MNRKTITLTAEDGVMLSKLVERTKSDASKVMRVALRQLYERQVSASVEEAYKKYYESLDSKTEEIVADLANASAPLW